MQNPVDVLKDLIRFNTANPPGNELPALRYIADLLATSGAEVVLDVLENETRGNLVACLPGTEAALPPLVMLSHIDVVAADPKQWCFPPFDAVEKDGYNYGRGTVDTKQLTVMELAAFLALSQHKIRKRTAYLVVTGDEECGSEMGLQHLLGSTITLNSASVCGRDLFENATVISEGGGFPIAAGDSFLYLAETGQKGCAQIQFTLRASGGVYLAGGGALRRAAGLVQELHETRLDSRVTETLRCFESALSAAYRCKPDELPQHLQPMMCNILTAMRRNTITPTLVEAQSVRQVTVTCDVRLLPGYTCAYLQSVAQPLADKWDADLQILSFSEGYESGAGKPLAVLQDCLQQELPTAYGALPVVPFLSMGSSDGRFLQPMHASVYGFSPVLPSDMLFDQAVQMVHGINERIHQDSVLFGCRVLTHAACRLCGAAEMEEA